MAEALAAAARELTGAGVEDARLEAQVLLGHALGVDRARVLARLTDQPHADEIAVFDALVRRRAAREPLAYVVGFREFYGLQLACAPGVLIPRPETEMLVDLALGEIGERGGDATVIDVGTGSGAIAVAIAINARQSHVTAIDISDAALQLARRNIDAHKLSDRVTLAQGDLLVGTGRFDVIVANLPYVTNAEYETLVPEIRDWEPREALVGGTTGLDVIERLLRQAPEHLSRGGVLAAEIGASQAAEAQRIAQIAFPAADICVNKDFAGLDRVLVVRDVG